MRRAILTAAAAVLAACATEPQAQHYSLAGHWYVTGGATAFDFEATDITLSAQALADSAARGYHIEAIATGQGCTIQRYRTSVDGALDDGTLLALTCDSPVAVDAATRYSSLPDTVRMFEVAGLTLEAK